MSVLRSVRPPAWGALGLAGVILVLGVTGRWVRSDMERLQRVLQQERVLNEHVERVRVEQVWLERQMPRALDLPEVLSEIYAPGSRIDVHEREPEPLSETLRLRSVDLVLNGVPWETVRWVVESFEAQTPPWRLVGMDVSSGLSGLEGDLRFEGLEWVQP